MKKITFPHMGNLYIPARAFFQELGYEVVVPPKITRRTLDLGVKHSPELACLPLKINLGNFIQALEKGADTIVMGGGVGPCRFGYYGEVQREILLDLGYEFEMIILEPEVLPMFKQLKKMLGGFNLFRMYRAGKLAWMKIKAMDRVHHKVLKVRGRERETGAVDRIYEGFLTRLDSSVEIGEINSLEREYLSRLEEAVGDCKRGREIKIGIVGEIYLVLESFSNLNLEKKLGNLGVTVDRKLYISHWISEFLNRGDHHLVARAARPYLESAVGGHGLESVGNAVRYARENYDGLIQVAPFTCMPEIVASTILPGVGKKEDIAVLSLVFDEHTGEAGLETRLEAFVDLLARKKAGGGKRVDETVLSGN